MHHFFQKLVRNSFFLGILFFTVQLLIILSICPENSLSQAWLSLASHWDSVWYEAIAKVGYIGHEGPNHIGPYTSNVAFFPGYPYLARAIILIFGVQAKIALLIVSQSAALLFWCLLFHILHNLAWREQIYAAILIMSFPTSWFLFMGYSESLFILIGCLMLWLAIKKRWVLSGISGVFMTATRLFGISILIAPLLSNLIIQLSHYNMRFQLKRLCLNARKTVIKIQLSIIRASEEVSWVFTPLFWVTIVGSLGTIGFLSYCYFAFGSWHLYFDIERVNWGANATPLFLFKLPTWVPPPFGFAIDWVPPLPIHDSHVFLFKFFRLAAYNISEILVPVFLWLFLIYSLFIIKSINSSTPSSQAQQGISQDSAQCHHLKNPRCAWDDEEVVTIKKTKNLDLKSLTWFIAALLCFFVSCLSTYTRHYESMSRLLIPVWILLIISDATHPDNLLFFRLKNYALGKIIIFIVIVISSGFWLQLINRFFLNWWVA